MTTGSPSSIPPKSKLTRQAAWTTLISGVGLLLSALATRVVLEPKPTPEPPAHADATKPIPVPPKEEATTNEGVVAARIVRDHANVELIEHRDRIHVLEMRVCILERELRAEVSRRLELQKGKRGREARKAFEQQTARWDACPSALGPVQERGSLREAADSL